MSIFYLRNLDVPRLKWTLNFLSGELFGCGFKVRFTHGSRVVTMKI